MTTGTGRGVAPDHSWAIRILWDSSYCCWGYKLSSEAVKLGQHEMGAAGCVGRMKVPSAERGEEKG